MNDELFNELKQSIREAGEIRRGGSMSDKLIEKYCTCEYGPILGDDRMDSNWCPVHDGTKDTVLEWGARGWDEVAALEQQVERLEELLYEAIEVGGAPESTWVDTDSLTKRAWPISDEEALAEEKGSK